ncbi:MAG: WbqC family protein [Paludibacter sp.]|nr:WbqC family protein [Paludibacter sp.]
MANKDGLYILSTAYLPPAEYFVALGKAEEVILEQYEHYHKQSYRNRCRIMSANGIMDLAIPVEKPGKAFIRDVKISDQTDWQTQHWRSIESAYSSSPFFEYYQDDFKPFFEKKWIFLWDFNFELLNKVLELLEMQCSVSFSDKYTSVSGGKDLRDLIHPKKEIIFSTAGYYQVFEQKYGFTDNLSIIDLLFNMGNESQLILNRSITG